MPLLGPQPLGEELLTPSVARIILLPETQASAGLIGGTERLEVHKDTLAALVVVKEQGRVCVGDCISHGAARLLEDGRRCGGGWEARAATAVSYVLEELALVGRALLLV